MSGPSFRPDGVLVDPDDPNRVIVTDEEHLAVRRSPTIRKMLASARLRRCVGFIDGSDNRAAALERAMLNPELRALVDEVLLATGKARRRPDGSVEFTG